MEKCWICGEECKDDDKTMKVSLCEKHKNELNFKKKKIAENTQKDDVE